MSPYYNCINLAKNFFANFSSCFDLISPEAFAPTTLDNHLFTFFTSYYDFRSLVAFAPPLNPPLSLDYNCIIIDDHLVTVFTSYYDLESLLAFILYFII